ncbi:MAG: hypothetical protein NT007_18500 [Candidatus Kapabacteria bacterium]|nr:hypothetical protein [Candidatus Kapabacteria bacterium]
MGNDQIDFKQDWKYTDPEECRKAQLLVTSKIPFIQKLEWLEQAQELIGFMRSKSINN